MERDYTTIKIIQAEFPALLYRPPYNIEGLPGMLKAIQTFAKYTREQLVEGNEAEIERCFVVAKTILKNGSNMARLAMENVFVYSVSRLLEISFAISQNERNLFLKFFREEYEAQIAPNHR